jgi:hypothetical protein
MSFRVKCETAVQIGQPEGESVETVLKKNKDTLVSAFSFDHWGGGADVMPLNVTST